MSGALPRMSRRVRVQLTNGQPGGASAPLPPPHVPLNVAMTADVGERRTQRRSGDRGGTARQGLSKLGLGADRSKRLDRPVERGLRRHVVPSGALDLAPEAL